MSNKEIQIMLTGGLGNQLFQYFTAIGLARKFGICKICFIISYNGTPDDPEPPLFNLYKTDEIAVRFRYPGKFEKRVYHFLLRLGLQINLDGKIKKMVINHFGSMVLREKLNFVISQDIGWFGDIDLKSKKNILIGYFQSYRYIESVISSSDRYLKPFPSHLSKWQKKSIEEKPLVVHLRAGDYLNNEGFGVLSKQYYLKAIDIIAKLRKINFIWVFSDDIDLIRTYFEENKENTFRFFDYREFSTVDSFYLMRLGYDFIIANSTFSWFSAITAYQNNSHTIYPKEWFKTIKSPNLLNPNSWFPLEAYWR
jgi:hypothetical protein